MVSTESPQEYISPEPTIDQSKWLRLDPQKFEVSIDISPTDEKKKYVSARLRKPSLTEDLEFTKQAATEYKEVSATEEQIVLTDQKASEVLFDKLVEEVKGYRFRHESKDAEAWRDDDAIKGVIPGSHKVAYIRGMRISSAKYLGDDDDCYIVGGGVLPVELTVGYESAPLGKILFDVPEPTESERTDFEEKSMRYLQGRGVKRKSNKMVTDMNVCVEFFDKLMPREGASIIGGRVGDQTFDKCTTPISKAAFLAAIDPTYKVKVIGAAMVKYAARLQD